MTSQNFPHIFIFLWAFFLFGGFLFGGFIRQWQWSGVERWMPRWARMSSSLALVLAAWSLFYLTKGDGHADVYSFWITLGISFGLIGDLALAHLLPGVKDKNSTVSGLGAFGIGHLCYISAMYSVISEPFFHVQFKFLPLFFWLLAGGICWYFVVFLNQKRRILHWLALPYCLLLSSTTGLAFGLAFQNDAFVFLAVGAILFLLSDFILAWKIFHDTPIPLIHDWVWLTYGPGQMLIVISISGVIAHS